MTTKLNINNAKKHQPATLEQLLETSDGAVTLNPEMQEQLKDILAKQGEKEVKKARKQHGKRKPKDPNAPKRPTTAYMRFLNTSRARIITEHFTDGDGECTLIGREKVTKVAQKGGELWGQMSVEEKKPFVDASEVAKTAYSLAMNDYVQSDPLPVEDDQPDAPDGWSGPFSNTYLRGLIKNHRKQFDRFTDAVTAAENLGSDVCGGITKSDKNGKYSLRKAGEGGPRSMEEACVSWVFGEAIILAPKAKNESNDAGMPAPKPQSELKTTPKKEALKKDAPKPLVVEEEVPKKVAPKKVAPKTTQKPLVVEEEVPKKVASATTPKSEPKPLVVEEEVELEIENDGDVESAAYEAQTEEEEDGETDVSVIEYEGKDYLVNPGNNEVYDFDVYQESEQIVTIGSWDPTTEKLTLI